MEKRRIGSSDVHVSPLMIGGANFGWTADRDRSFAILDAFVGAGFNGIDTADVYSGWVPGNVGGESETIIGEWIASRGGRDRLTISTKVGANAREFGKGNLTASNLVKVVEASLGRLQTDYVDICHAHAEDTVTPIDESLEAFDRLVQAGKVRIAGGSNYSLSGLTRALDLGAGRGRYQCYQPQYSLCERREFEGGYQQLCRAHGLGVVCHSALAKGFLTAKYQDEKALDGLFWADVLRKYGEERGKRILGALRAIAGRRDLNPGQVALAWLIAQPGVTAAILSVNSVAEFEELQGAEEVNLDATELDELTSASAYPPADVSPCS